MSDLQTEMNRVVQGFVAQITELARRAAVDTLQSALGGGGSVAVARCRRGRSPARPRREAHGRRARPARRRIRRRSCAKNPGLRIEQINKQLGTSTKDLALPIRKLIADGAVKTKGKKRSTTYFPGEASAQERTRMASWALDTIPHRLLRQAVERPSTIAYQAKVNGRWQPTTWRVFVDQIRTAARALIALGFPRGGKVAILGFNRPEWVILDHAAMMAGGARRGHLHDVLAPRRSSTSCTTPRRTSCSSRTRRSCAKVEAKRARAAACSSTIVMMRGAPAIGDRRADVGRLPREGATASPTTSSTSASTRSSRPTSRR